MAKQPKIGKYTHTFKQIIYSLVCARVKFNLNLKMFANHCGKGNWTHCKVLKSISTVLFLFGENKVLKEFSLSFFPLLKIVCSVWKESIFNKQSSNIHMVNENQLKTTWKAGTFQILFKKFGNWIFQRSSAIIVVKKISWTNNAQKRRYWNGGRYFIAVVCHWHWASIYVIEMYNLLKLQDVPIFISRSSNSRRL